MSMSLEFELKKEYLHVTISGTFSIDEACRCFRENMAIVAGCGATRVLVDCLQLEGHPSFIDGYQYGQFIATELYEPRRAKKLHIAYVAAAPLIDNYRFSELVAINRGASMKSTETTEEALKWLGINPEK
jgi:hypothetical protein